MTTIEISLAPKSNWIEMFPFGVALGADNLRPVMIFKDKAERRVLPVWLSHMDAGIAVAQGGSPYSGAARVDGSPHELSWHILSLLGVELEKCLFKKVKDNHQYVELHFKSSSKKKLPKDIEVIEARADDAISFCLRAGCKFFATHEYIERSRVLEVEIIMARRSLSKEVNPHPYLN